MPQVKYMRHESDQGMSVDPDKVKAIQDMPKPKCAKDRLIGTVKYLSKFIPHLADILEPVRSLLKKGMPLCGHLNMIRH